MNNFIKNSKFIIQHLITPIFILFLLSCSNTGPQTGNLSGTINLEAQSDHSGIIIGIYELAELDPEIVEANHEWPHIGVVINQHTEFDHRFGTLVKTGETDASGYFEIKNISTGSYNVVAIKDGYGFRYIYDIQIKEGENDILSPRSTLTLYPETIVNPNISVPTTWLTNHHYIIEQNIVVEDEITIKPGAVVRLNQGKNITSYGTINAVGEYENFIWFTKNDGFSENLSSTEPDPDYIWDQVNLESPSQAEIQWCKFDWANIGLLNHINGFEISDCIFRDSQCGFKAESLDSIYCTNLYYYNIYGDIGGAIYYIDVNNGTTENNILYVCNYGFRIKDHSNPIFKNNFINNCNIGIDVSYHSSPQIIFNELINCKVGINTYLYSCLPLIENNYIKSINGIINKQHFSDINIEVHYNNIESEIYCFELQDYGTTANINAEYNYFYTVSEDEINELIYDRNDYSGPEPEDIGYVYYQPFLNQEFYNAGIKEE